MIDWDPQRRRLPRLGVNDLPSYYSFNLVAPISSAMQATWANTDLLLPKNLLSSDSPMHTNAMTIQYVERGVVRRDFILLISKCTCGLLYIHVVVQP